MRQTVATNPLFKLRPKTASLRLKKLVDAYRDRDIDTLAALTMEDSNEMHSLMLGTVPSIRYLNGLSFEVMDRIEQLNLSEGRRIAGYTFDAGPNPQIITLKKHRSKVLDALKDMMDSGEIKETVTSPVGCGPVLLDEKDSVMDEGLLSRHLR